MIILIIWIPIPLKNWYRNKTRISLWHMWHMWRFTTNLGEMINLCDHWSIICQFCGGHLDIWYGPRLVCYMAIVVSSVNWFLDHWHRPIRSMRHILENLTNNQVILDSFITILCYFSVDFFFPEINPICPYLYSYEIVHLDFLILETEISHQNISQTWIRSWSGIVARVEYQMGDHMCQWH